MTTEIECVPECNHPTFKYLKNLTKLERSEFFNSFDIVFSDCDGVIWHHLGEGIPGVATVINVLRNQGKKVTFVTNNSIVPIDYHLRKFQNLNIDVEKEDIIHPAQTVCDYLKSQNFDGLILCIASTPFKNLLRNAGFQLAETNENINTESLHELTAEIFNDAPVKAIVIDIDINLTATKLMRAQVHLKSPDCLFIAGAADETVQLAGRNIIGSGPFINVVERAAKRKAVALGKPGIDLSEILMERFKLHNRSQRVLFIGDSLTSDIRFAKMCGFQTLLVLSGVTRASDLHTPRPNTEIPDYVALSLAEINEIL